MRLAHDKNTYLQLTHTVHIHLTYALELVYASAAALSARAGGGGSCYIFIQYNIDTCTIIEVHMQLTHIPYC